MRAISSMATREVLTDLATAAVHAGLAPLEIESVGGVVAAQRVAEGEPFDLIFLAADALDKLAAQGYVDARSVTPILLSQVAVAVSSETENVAERPDRVAFADASAMRAALKDARKIGYSTGPSGTALLRMIDEWGMTEELRARLVQSPPGVPVAQSLAHGDLGFQQLSELLGQPRTRILGVLPEECAIVTVFSGAIAATASDPIGAAKILEFFASEQAVQVKEQRAFSEPDAEAAMPAQASASAQPPAPAQAPE